MDLIPDICRAPQTPHSRRHARLLQMDRPKNAPAVYQSETPHGWATTDYDPGAFAAGSTPRRRLVGCSADRYTRCTAFWKSSGFAKWMFGTNFCGLRSTSGNHVLWI